MKCLLLALWLFLSVHFSFYNLIHECIAQDLIFIKTTVNCEVTAGEWKLVWQTRAHFSTYFENQIVCFIHRIRSNNDKRNEEEEVSSFITELLCKSTRKSSERELILIEIKESRMKGNFSYLRLNPITQCSSKKSGN